MLIFHFYYQARCLTKKTRYFEAASVSVKTNITWAGQVRHCFDLRAYPRLTAALQTFGNKFKVDGVPKGELNITKIACNQGANQCLVPVKAPSFALVFLIDPTATEAEAPAVTFETTAFTKTINTATVDPSVLATSNGQSGKERSKLGSTSSGSVNGAEGLRALIPGISVLLAVLCGAGFVASAFAR